jgi:penicillin-binding protein 1A
MSGSERDIPPHEPDSGDLATSTPLDESPVADPAALNGSRNGRSAHLRAVPDGRGPGSPRGRARRPGDPPPPPRVRIRKLRMFAILLGLGVLALVSTVFGMMMAVTSDLPQLEDPPVRNSVLVDRNGRRLGLLTGSERRIFVRAADIAPVMKQAIIAIEDRRFYTNDGIDLRGIARALYQDVVQKRVVQGGSTITQQFVKNALAAQDDRTVFQKLREAALAFQITRKWSKERILRNYLNTIYFGNGAYGIESAAETYFGRQHPRCGEPGERRCAAQLDVEEAALLAGMVASPSGYDPLAHPEAAARRRALVLDRMVQEHFLTDAQRREANAQSLPTRADVRPPAEDTAYPYFTSWIKQQVVDRLGGGQTGARLAFEGGLTVRTTLDADLEDAAEAAVDRQLPALSGPRASLVALDNRTGEVLAMVGGDDYRTQPFNLATQGRRQPGSAFKPFVLAQALREGVSPNSVWESRKRSYCVTPGKKECRELFEVNNYEDAYAGLTTLARATTFSDNSVFAALGIQVGTKKIAKLARRMGIRTPVSHNLAMTLGGLRQGVTPLDMAHAYETFAHGGRLVFGTMSPGAGGPADGSRRAPVPGPVGVKTIGRMDDGRLLPIELPSGARATNRRRERRVISPDVAAQVSSLLEGVVQSGTATRAQIPGVFIAGKTGTTENYGDAWFVGWTRDITVAVWVGYPDELRPMQTEYAGEPVAGGTYPALIFKDFVEQAMALGYGRREEPEVDPTLTTPAPAPTTTTPAAPSTTPSTAPSTTAPSTTEPATPAPETQAPAPAEEPAPADTAPAAPEEPAPAEPGPADPAATDSAGGTAPQP